MSDHKKWPAARSCTVGAGQRTIRGIIALTMAAFAVSFAPIEPVIAIVAGVLAIGVTIMAVTGFCPAAWFSLRQEIRAADASHGYADATGVVRLSETTE